uniref:Uncharacterized protein n=1 Tax=Rhodosorus marinus TaxID=101924 RepID=A0A6T6L931_9RHOD|mmetsp:Transcript_16441/g.23768  ORF Transcript_16441/g.23768 Transcript_16441/m.23768 type:complete len:104 (+) Transcript_16441:492-803(+)
MRRSVQSFCTLRDIELKVDRDFLYRSLIALRAKRMRLHCRLTVMMENGNRGKFRLSFDRCGCSRETLRRSPAERGRIQFPPWLVSLCSERSGMREDRGQSSNF